MFTKLGTRNYIHAWLAHIIRQQLAIILFDE